MQITFEERTQLQYDPTLRGLKLLPQYLPLLLFYPLQYDPTLRGLKLKSSFNLTCKLFSLLQYDPTLRGLKR